MGYGWSRKTLATPSVHTQAGSINCEDIRAGRVVVENMFFTKKIENEPHVTYAGGRVDPLGKVLC